MDTPVDFINQRSSVARKSQALTGKTAIIVLSDEACSEIPGLPKNRGHVYVPFGQFNTLTVKMAQTFGELAAVYLAPALTKKKVYPMDVRRIRQLTNAESALLIWDDLDGSPDDLSESSSLRKNTVVDFHLKKTEFRDHNQHETEFVFAEIFDRRTYLKHGLTIKDGDVIIDVGANIGLFSLFAKQCAPECEVYAFEPSREVFEILKKNTRAFGESVRCSNVGVSESEELKDFTFYPGYSVISGFHTDRRLDQSVIIAGENFKDRPASEETISSRFEEAKTYACQTYGLSELIKLNGLTRIDYLKIDAEKSELGILKGINLEDWSKIFQVAIEVHGAGRKDEINEILLSQQFKTWVEIAIETPGETIFTIYGKRV